MRNKSLLAASALLNLALVGFVAVLLLAPRHDALDDTAPALAGGPLAERPFAALRDLPGVSDDQRAAVRAAISPHLPALRNAKRQTHAARTAFRQALAREPFDAETARTAAQALHAARGQQWSAATDALTDVMTALPAETRRELLARMHARRGDGLRQVDRPAD